jgi:cell division ATPase MinD
MTRIIVVSSGKGGVGKTTTSVNLADALTDFGRSVVVVDGNITTPNVALHLGIKNTPYTLHDVLDERIPSIRNATYLHRSGVRVVPAGISIYNLRREVKKNLGRAILDLIGAVDFIIIDSAAGLGKEARASMEAANEILIVTNPELPAVTDALKAVELAKSFNTKPLGVVVNKYSGDSFEMSPANIEAFLNTHILSVIPESKMVKLSLSKKNTVVNEFPSSNVTRKFRELAANLIGEKYEYKEEKGFRARIRNIFGGSKSGPYSR